MKTIPSWLQSVPKKKVYSGRIRDGLFGSLTDREYDVISVAERGLSFLSPFPAINYESPEYRNLVNGSAKIEDYIALHAKQQHGYLQIFKDLLATGKIVADCGCGGGALLDLIKQSGAKTIAIEPFSGFHESLKSRGHMTYDSVASAGVTHAGSVDLALSFHVIEHVEDPVHYLSEIRGMVKPGGYICVLTPNWNDILMQIDRKRMEPFFYRKVHNYYFTAESLAWVGKLAGWHHKNDIFYHEFGLANTLNWLRDGQPSGHGRLEAIDETADLWWKAYLELNGLANNVGVLLHNPESNAEI